MRSPQSREDREHERGGQDEPSEPVGKNATEHREVSLSDGETYDASQRLRFLRRVESRLAFNNKLTARARSGLADFVALAVMG